jgi:formylglycine-generating enzyme required for sulfatase activity
MAETAPKAASETETPPVDAPEGMVHVLAGPFLWGPRKEEVSLGDFWIDIYPVTNGDYEDYVTTHRKRAPRHWPASGLTDSLRDQPIVFLTYAEAEDYAETLGKQLPTPAQYEKAARGTEGWKYPWGNQVKNRVANTRESARGKLSTVDAYGAGRSPFGCYDMCGNALNWTRGVYDEKKGTRIVMGSSFKHYLGAAYFTHEEDPEKRRDYLGFRCVWTPPRP